MSTLFKSEKHKDLVIQKVNTVYYLQDEAVTIRHIVPSFLLSVLAFIKAIVLHQPIFFFTI